MRDIPEQLIINAAGGDISAFEEIYNIASGYVYAVAFRITGNREDAEEVAQDVFLSVHRNLGKFGFRSSLKTWIYRITANRAINAYRKRMKHKKRHIEFDDTIKNELVHEDRPDGLDKKESKHIVSAMLGRLPEEQKACLILKDIEGLKYQEIAKALNIKINTVRTRLKRGREKLLAIYGNRGD